MTLKCKLCELFTPFSDSLMRVERDIGHTIEFQQGHRQRLMKYLQSRVSLKKDITAYESVTLIMVIFQSNNFEKLQLFCKDEMRKKNEYKHLNNITHDPFRTPMPGVNHRSFVTSTPYHQIRQGSDDNSIATMQTSTISNQTDSASFAAAGILLAPMDNNSDVSNLVRMTSTMCAYASSVEQNDSRSRSDSKILNDDQGIEILTTKDKSSDPGSFRQSQMKTPAPKKTEATQKESIEEVDGLEIAENSDQEEKGRRPPFTNSHRLIRQGGKYHLLIGVTGSVAVIKLQELIDQLYKFCPQDRLWIKVVATGSAVRLLETQDHDIEETIYEDRDEWSMWRDRGDPVLHIELRKWADSMLLAPLDANTLAKIANGLCDNLVTSVVRAWDPRKPLYFAPAMNTMMWENPLTFQHRKTLKDLLRFKEIPPMEKELMCGDTGVGAMASVTMISTILATDVKNRFAIYTESVTGVVKGYSRRFWQLSPDHRGTPDNSQCWGIAFKVAEKNIAPTRAYLDHREKAGYSVYMNIGNSEHHSGPSEIENIAQTILISHGPSGPNLEYALRIADVLHKQARHLFYYSQSLYTMNTSNDIAVQKEGEPLLEGHQNSTFIPRAIGVAPFGHRRNQSTDVKLDESKKDNFTICSENPEKNNPSIAKGDVNNVPSIMEKSTFARKKLTESRNINLPNITLPEQSDVISIRVYISHVVKEDIEENEERVAGVQFDIEGGRTASAEFLVQLMSAEYKIEQNIAAEAFALWMVSPLLEVQLKPHHCPFEVRRGWPTLLARFANDASEEEVAVDEPVLFFRRNVQLSEVRENEIVTFCGNSLELLFLDARSALFLDRLPMSPIHAAELAGIGFALDYGVYDVKQHTCDFIRKNIETQLPEHLAYMIRGPMVFGRALSGTKELENMLIESWKASSNGLNTNGLDELRRQYLVKIRESSPCYGSAFFRGIIERPSVSPLNLKRFFQAVTSGVPDVEVRIGINLDCITVFDIERRELLLVQKIVDCSWRKIGCTQEQIEDGAEPVLLLQFPDEEPTMRRARRLSKTSDRSPLRTNLLQVFGCQAVLMDALLTSMRIIIDVQDQPDATQMLGKSRMFCAVRRVNFGSVLYIHCNKENGRIFYCFNYCAGYIANDVENMVHIVLVIIKLDFNHITMRSDFVLEKSALLLTLNHQANRNRNMPVRVDFDSGVPAPQIVSGSWVVPCDVVGLESKKAKHIKIRFHPSLTDLCRSDRSLADAAHRDAIEDNDEY
uniref:Glutathione-specific gamma-glutamylcyclotransferase n=1 Tax=Heterorhabditis bacteriophora TaxID=37862 RepID=A0A1I7XNF8_HETBA